MKRAVLAVVVSLTLAGAVRAQDSADDARKSAAREEARQHVAKAKVHYDLGEFKEAADEYILVYRLRPIPAILFNVAQAYRQGGIYEKARQFYKSYLLESPDAKNRAMIEQAIKDMDALLAKEKRTKDQAPMGVKEPAEASLALEKATSARQPVTQQAAESMGAKPVVSTASPRPSVPTAATHSTSAPAVVEEDDPLYKKWWLWTAVGVVVAGAGVAALTMGGNSAPTSHFGTTPVFP